MCNEIELEEMISNTVEKTITEMFSRFENRFETNMANKMNVMSNSFAYITKMLEDSGIASTNIDKRRITWQTDMKNIIYELVSINRSAFPSYNSVIKTVCLRMRDVYGVVIDQLRKDYRDKYNLDSSPDILEVISDNKTVKNLFETIIRGLLPKDYQFRDDNLSDDEYSDRNRQEDAIKELIKPLAEKYNDSSKGYSKTLRVVYKHMDCSWTNLQTRYKNNNNLKTTPQKMTIITNNQYVFRKFKKCVQKLLDDAG